jgi:hypothetical protein
MVGQQQSERHLRVELLCCFDALCRHAIKTSIPSYNEIGHAVFGYVALDLSRQFVQQSVRGLTVSNKVTD